MPITPAPLDAMARGATDDAQSFVLTRLFDAPRPLVWRRGRARSICRRGGATPARGRRSSASSFGRAARSIWRCAAPTASTIPAVQRFAK